MTRGLLELGEIMLTHAQRRLDNASRNIANLSTPGYKAAETFQNALDESAAAQTAPIRSDFSQGPIRTTGRPLDLAISGSGFFRLAGEAGIYFSRNGQFTRDSEGRVVGANGLALQSVGGEDLVIRGDVFEILEDGVVLEDGRPVTRIALYEPHDAADLEALGGTIFSASNDVMQESTTPTIRNGALEMANTDNAAQMVGMMATLRQAEAGARIVQAYDGLIGQAISTFGKTTR